MTVDEFEREEMAQVILREKDAEEKLAEAREELALWVKRGKLALKVGRDELAREAKRRALQAKQAFLEATQELELVAGAKRRLRREARRPDDLPTTNAELLVEQFRMQGFAPEEQELEEIADRQAARMAVEAMKRGRGAAASPAVEEAPADAADEAAPPETSPVEEAATEEGPSSSDVEAESGQDAADSSETDLSDEEVAALEGVVPPPRASRPPDMSAIERELASLKAAAGGSPPASDADAEALAEIERALATPPQPRGDETD